MVFTNELFLRNKFSANFQLLVAINPCPCAGLNNPQKSVGLRLLSLPNANKRISGLLLDCIDIHIEVPRVDYEKLSSDRLGETSETIRKRVHGYLPYRVQDRGFLRRAQVPFL